MANGQFPAGPDHNQTLLIRGLLGVFIVMLLINTCAQFLQVEWKDPIYLLSSFLPIFSAVIFAYYKRKQEPARKQHILIIEDSLLWARLIRLSLDPNLYNVSVYTSTEKALVALSERQDHELPDQIILDFGLPDGQSAAVLQELKASPRFDHIPVVVLAATQTDEDEESKQLAAHWVDKMDGSRALKKAVELSSTKTDLGAVLKLPRRKEKVE